MSMQISERTKNLLGNFAQINNSIYIKPGSKISTIAVTKNVFATAEVNEQFPEAFAIYDLGQFLNGWNLFADSSQVDFQFNNESFLTIKSGRSKLKYFYCDPDVLILPPDKELGLPETQFSFQLNEDVLVSLLKASRVLRPSSLERAPPPSTRVADGYWGTNGAARRGFRAQGPQQPSSGPGPSPRPGAADKRARSSAGTGGLSDGGGRRDMSAWNARHVS